MTGGSRAAIGALLVAMALGAVACRRGPAPLTQLQSVKTGAVEIVLLSDHDALRHGKDAFIVEFRSGSTGNLVDVGAVRASANMAMPGMPMFASIDVQRTDVPGRYAANGEFSMAGRWRISVEWDGPAGRGSVNFSGTVQ